MYIKHKIILIILGVLSLVICFLYQNKTSENSYDAIVTFLSILFGFTLTAFTTLFSSKFVSDLYKTQDKENKYITLKHRLKNYFLTSFNISIVSIIFLLVFPNKLTIYNISFYKEMFIFPIILVNSCMYYILLHYLGKLFIKNKAE